MYDELQLDTLGDKKTALFLIMSDTDATFNFLISMVYTQLFNLLCEKADDVYGGRLPVHVTCLIDEMANIGQIPNLEKLMATIRSREISAALVLQAKSQLKAIYKDNADTIIGNCDSQIFLGGSEQTTLKDLYATLGKETIDMYVKYIKPADNKDIQIRVVIMPDMKDDKPVITTNITIFDKRIKAGEVSSKDMSELEFNKLIYEIQREYGIKKCNLGKSREMQNDFQSAVRSGIRVLQTM